MHALQRGPYRRQTLVAFLLASAACARQAESGPPPFTPGHGRFVWTDSASHEDKRPAYHTRCGSVLHVWVRDTLSPDLTTYMVVGILGFEDRTREVPAYADFDGRRVGAEAHAGLYAADNTQLATVVGRLRFDRATVDYLAGHLSGRLVWRTRWDQKPDTSGTILLDFSAPRRRGLEQSLCHGPRM
jgi:hypothetical protein